MVDQVDWYDLPLYYDIIFEEDTVLEADFLESLQRQHGRTRGKKAIEPACGSGRLLAELSRRGWDVHGLDGNEAMLEFAEKWRKDAGLSYTLASGRLESFRAEGHHDLAFCLVSTFKYLLTEEDARSHLLSVSRSLKPGGIYVLGLHLTDYESTSRSRERWTGERHGVHVVSNLQCWPAEREERLEQVRVRLNVTEKSNPARTLETHWKFRTYSLQELRSLLATAPFFELVATHDFYYDPDTETPFDGERLDVVLVLRRVKK